MIAGFFNYFSRFSTMFLGVKPTGFAERIHVFCRNAVASLAHYRVSNEQGAFCIYNDRYRPSRLIFCTSWHQNLHYILIHLFLLSSALISLNYTAGYFILIYFGYIGLVALLIEHFDHPFSVPSRAVIDLVFLARLYLTSLACHCADRLLTYVVLQFPALMAVSSWVVIPNFLICLHFSVIGYRLVSEILSTDKGFFSFYTYTKNKWQRPIAGIAACVFLGLLASNSRYFLHRCQGVFC